EVLRARNVYPNPFLPLTLGPDSCCKHDCSTASEGTDIPGLHIIACHPGRSFLNTVQPGILHPYLQVEDVTLDKRRADGNAGNYHGSVFGGYASGPTA